MLKRYQVLLNDWMADYSKFVAEQYDWSFSETIRLTMCVAMINWVSSLYPKKFRTSYKFNKLVKMMRQYRKSADTLDESLEKELSKIYFEARKAAEVLMSQEKNKNRK